MSVIELFFLAVGLSMDTFAVAVTIGMAVVFAVDKTAGAPPPHPRKLFEKSLTKTSTKIAHLRDFRVYRMFTAGLCFGFFQAVMPLIGFFAARNFADVVMDYSSVISFVLLLLIGGKMIVETLREGKGAGDSTAGTSVHHMPVLAIATSIDALAVGVSFAFLYVEIVPAVLIIGATTFVIAAMGVWVGSAFGQRFRARAGLLGGVILILIGLRILLF